MKNLSSCFALLLLFFINLIPFPVSADMLGDTLHVGTTWYDTPQPSSSPNSLIYLTGEDDSGMLNLLWFNQETADTSPLAYRSRIDVPEDLVDGLPDNTLIDRPQSATVGGVAVHPLYESIDVYMFTQDYSEDTHGLRPYIAQETAFPFFEFLPFYEWSDQANLYNNPHAAFNGGEEDLLHTIYTCFSNPDDGTMSTLYSNWLYSPYVSQIFFEQTAFQEPPIITDGVRQPASDIAVSGDGTHVVIAQLVARDEETGDREEIRDFNNDLYLYESFDSGDTWNVDSPTNVTNWFGPEENLLPDTTAANRDTLRCVTDARLLIDSNDVVHVYFTVASVRYFEGAVRPESRIFHWDNETQFYTQVADGVSRFSGFLDSEGHTVSHPAVAIETRGDLEITWVAFQKVSNLDGDPFSSDVANGYACNDIWLTLSPNSGLNWSEPINITQSTWDSDIEMQPGDARSETWLSMVKPENRDELLLSYIVDTWPGDQTESAVNLVVVHRVLTQDAFDLINERMGGWWQPWEGWLRNYPLHIDSTGFYDEPYDYHHDSVEPGEQHPVEFVFDPVTPNPFNPTATISFRLGSNSDVKLAVYDVLGREVAVLLDRTMQPGQHWLVFSGESLASGVYFCRLQVGGQSRVQKMMLLR